MSAETTTVAERFAFGENWARFLSVLDESRIVEAETSLRRMLRIDDLRGRTFLDVGSGSGLFSLAALRLGAKRVHSFDYDPASVACALELRSRYAPDAVHWMIERGDVLNEPYLRSLGQWDVVYSWGVLHHTGAMWRALENVTPLVAASGLLYIAIYNDQGRASRIWHRIKRLYNTGPAGKMLVTAGGLVFFVGAGAAKDILTLRNPAQRYRQYGKKRGMSIMHDFIDWLGGYPFEVAKPEEIFDFYHARGFSLVRMTTAGGRLGCNQFVFERVG